MGARPSISKNQGIRTVSLTYNQSNSLSLAQNTRYWLRYASTQSGPNSSDSDKDAPGCPFDGTIVGCSFAMRMTGATNTSDNTFSIVIRPGFQIGVTTSKKRTEVISRTFKLNGNYSRLFECNIPVYEGETITPEIFTSAFGATTVPTQMEAVFFIEAKSKKGTGISGLIETQSLFFNWSAGSITFNDNTFRQIPAWMWTSAPAENTYNTGTVNISRLNGAIKAFCIGGTSAGVTQEPFSVEVVFQRSQYLNSASATGQAQNVTVGKYYFFNNRNGAPNLIKCNIPIRMGQGFYLILRSENMATNSTSWQFGATAYIEGTTGQEEIAILPKNEIGLKNADYTFAYNVNNTFASNTRYFSPCPVQTGLAWGTTITTAHSSMYDGIICGATVAMVRPAGEYSNQDTEFGVAYLNKNLTVKSYNPICNIKLRFQFTGNGNPTRLFKAKVPIKKGEIFIPYIRTQGFTATDLIRLYSAIHIRGN